MKPALLLYSLSMALVSSSAMATENDIAPASDTASVNDCNEIYPCTDIPLANDLPPGNDSPPANPVPPGNDLPPANPAPPGNDLPPANPVPPGNDSPPANPVPPINDPPSANNPPSDWQAIQKRKRDTRAALLKAELDIPPQPPGTIYSPREKLLQSGLLTPDELDLTNTTKHDLTETARRIAAGQLTAEQVVSAFIRRATIAHSLANHLTEINFEAARIQARALDAAFNQSGGSVKGPLHGVPITIKDAMDLDGFASSEGLTRYANDTAPANGPLIQILIDAGAIVIAKTNMPQTGLAADTDSVVWGRTLNAYNSAFGAGGSSGGEGVAMATSSSLLGVGSDGAGSCRMPGLANGVIGYRPSGYRLPSGSRNLPWRPGRGALTAIGPVPGEGLFGHSVRDIRLVARLVAESPITNAGSVYQYPNLWRNVSLSLSQRERRKQVRVGVWDVETRNTFIHLSPPALRGYKTAQERLRAAGFELVRFQPPDQSGTWQLDKEFLAFQGVEGVAEALAMEPVTRIVALTGAVSPEMAFPADVHVLYALNERLAALTAAVDDAWNNGGQPIDFLLSPTAGHTALPLDNWTDTGYTGIFNSVDFPAMNLPLDMFADRAVDDEYGDDFEPFGDEDLRLKKLYNRETYHGLPLSVQLSARRFRDEELLAFAEEVHEILKGREGDD